MVLVSYSGRRGGRGLNLRSFVNAGEIGFEAVEALLLMGDGGNEFLLVLVHFFIDGQVAGGDAVARGVEYLIATQTEKGLWDEQRFTATGFPRVFYLRYHGYPKFFPLWALARYRNLRNTNNRVVGVGM